MCTKTNGANPTPSKLSICAAYSELKPAFDYLVPSDELEKASLYGVIVRLAFHDAGEIDLTLPEDKLGPDGCVSNTRSNAGLIEADSLILTVLEPLWQQHCDRISRADFWVLIAKLTIERAASAPIEVDFQYGRRDSHSCDATAAGRLPKGEGGMEDISRVFETQMGLTLEDAGKLLTVSCAGIKWTDPLEYMPIPF